MLLKITNILSIFALCFFVSGNGILLEQYSQKIGKEVVKIFDLDSLDDFGLDKIESPYDKIELYRIMVAKELVGYLYIKEVKSCSLNGCTASNVQKDNINSEYFDIAVIANLEQKVLSVKVLDYFSDYGYEIASKRYLKQYQQKSICDLSMDNPQVDGISGATISYNALLTSFEDFCSLQTD